MNHVSLDLISSSSKRTTVILSTRPGYIDISHASSGKNITKIPLPLFLAAVPSPAPVSQSFLRRQYSVIASDIAHANNPSSLFAILNFEYPYYSRKTPKLKLWRLEAETVDRATEVVEWLTLLAERSSKHYLVIVNPYAGKFRACKVWENITEPLFKIAGITFEKHETTDIGDATRIVQQLNLKQYAAVVCISGDGVVNEVINGLFSRPDWEEARLTPLAVIPAGSGNALATTIDICEPEIATLNAINCQVRPVDIFSVSQFGPNGSEVIRYGFLSLSWSLVADIDIESEDFRCLGSLRFDAAALFYVFKMRSYCARLSFLPAETDESLSGQLPSVKDGNPLETSYNQVQDAALKHSEPKSGTNGIHNDKRKYGPQPRFLYTKPEVYRQHPWVQLNPDNYNYFLACNMAHMNDFNAAPYARLNDGCIDLMYDTKGNPWKYLKAFLDQSSGKYISSVSHYKIQALVLEPLDPSSPSFESYFDVLSSDSSQNSLDHLPKISKNLSKLSQNKKWKQTTTKKSSVVVDGEKIEHKNTAIEIMGSLGRFIIPCWLDENRHSRNVPPLRQKKHRR